MIVNAFKNPGMTAAQIARTFRVSDTHAIDTLARYVDMRQQAEALNRIVKDIKRNGCGYQNFSYLKNHFLFSQRENAAILGVQKPLEEMVYRLQKKE